jgi:hypothetical protein
LPREFALPFSFAVILADAGLRRQDAGANTEGRAAKAARNPFSSVTATWIPAFAGMTATEFSTYE